MIDSVISQYPEDCQPTSVRSLGNAGGFSGAQFWQLQTPRGELCLRRWPHESPSQKRLAFIQLIVDRVYEAGCHFVPKAIRTTSLKSWVPLHGTLFELTPWMPGEPTLSPTASAWLDAPEKLHESLSKAMRALAEFHVAAAGNDVVDLGPSTGLQKRWEFTERLVRGDLEDLQSRLCASSCAALLREKLATILRLAEPRVHELPGLLRTARNTQFKLQPCIRDIWYDHVLFENEQVSGLVDFGALETGESVGCDISRLLTSVEVHICDAWKIGVAAYDEVRPLLAEERDSLVWYRNTTIALSGLNWARWLLVEGRTFENQERVARRLDELILWLALD